MKRHNELDGPMALLIIIACIYALIGVWCYLHPEDRESAAKALHDAPTPSSAPILIHP